jgi:light-regulated signal transduction histidine kinase (bacteriophytochrome)
MSDLAQGFGSTSDGQAETDPELSMSRTTPTFGNVNLTDCDREPIRIPGSIQPHGLLLALDPGSMTIVQVAGDTQRLLGPTHSQLLGQSLTASLGAAALTRVESMLRKHQVLPRPFFIIDASFDGRPLEITAHLSEGLVILELEPRPKDNGFDAIETVQAMTARAECTQSLPDLLNTVVKQVAEVSGFDRVMLYRFREDDSGHVVAEHRRSESVESFLDLHYPASDIPVQARELFCNNWIRTIPDVGYRPQPLDPQDNPITGRPLDLGFSALRSVSPLHLEYLGNMGVAASMSLSLVVEGKLWGLIACHHGQPFHIGARTRAALELFAQLVSLQIRSRIDLDRSTAGLRARNIQEQLVVAMTAGGLGQLLSAEVSLLDLIPVRGAALLIDGEINLRGATPTASEIEGLTQWLDRDMVNGVYATDRLSDHYPPAIGFLDSAAGLLALSISRSHRDFVLWFLPELIGTVTWAGDPTKPIVHGPLGDRLTPRKSFAAWTEMVRGRSRPWTDVEIESATALRTAILEVVLKKLGRTIREQEAAAKTHLDLLMAELDHRVKNTLATIQAVVRFSGRHAANIVDYSNALERRIGAMANSHTLLTLGGWKGAPLRALIEDELCSHRPRGHASIQLTGEDVDLDPKAASAVGMVLHELATNAVKHGSLSVEGGAVSLSWSQTQRAGQDWLEIEWLESGGPPVTPPTRTGFGRTLLERVFAADVQGRAALDFRREGLRCVLEIPQSHVVAKARQSVPPATVVSLSATPENTTPLQGLKVLVVEDAALISLELCETLTNFGAEIVGPCSQIKEALIVGASQAIDLALLDVDLNGVRSWPVAALLADRHIPFLFATGYTDTALRPPLFQNIGTIHKPYDTALLVSMMVATAAQKSGAAA